MYIAWDKWIDGILSGTPAERDARVRNIAITSLRHNSVTPELVRTKWIEIEAKFKELCSGQANKAWFILRKFTATSSTAKAMVDAFLDELLNHADADIKRSAQACKQFIGAVQTADEEKASGEVEEKKNTPSVREDMEKTMMETILPNASGDIRKIFTENELKGMQTKHLVAIIDQMNLSFNKKLIKSHYKTNQSRISMILEKQGEGVLFGVKPVERTPEAELFSGLLKTWFMPKISPTNRPGLKQGSLNEERVRVGVKAALFQQGLLLLDQREYGLLSNNARPAMCDSPDGIVLLWDIESKEVISAVLEIKTTTNANTTSAARAIALNKGKFHRFTVTEDKYGNI